MKFYYRYLISFFITILLFYSVLFIHIKTVPIKNTKNFNNINLQLITEQNKTNSILQKKIKTQTIQKSNTTKQIEKQKSIIQNNQNEKAKITNTQKTELQYQEPQNTELQNTSSIQLIKTDLLQTLNNKIQNNLVYPENARRRKIEGTVLLQILFYSNGQLQNVNILQSSGSNILDNTAIKLIQNIFPLSNNSQNFFLIDTTVTINYQLE